MTDTPRVRENTDLGNVTRGTKRSRPKNYARDSKYESRSYWLDEVFVEQGWYWVTDLAEVNHEGN